MLSLYLPNLRSDCSGHLTWLTCSQGNREGVQEMTFLVWRGLKVGGDGTGFLCLLFLRTDCPRVYFPSLGLTYNGEIA